MTTGEAKDPKGAAQQTPEGEKGQTPTETPTLTQKEADAQSSSQVAKALHAVSTDTSRLEKELERSQNVGKAALKRLKEVEEAQLRAEREDAQEDPAKLSAIDVREQANQARAEAAEDVRKAETIKADAQTQFKEVQESRAERLSEKYNIDSATLLEYGGDTKTSMEKLAKSYGEKTGSEGESETEANRMKEAPDSGKTKGTAGQGKKPSLEEVKAATPAEYDAKVKSGEWAPLG